MLRCTKTESFGSLLGLCRFGWFGVLSFLKHGAVGVSVSFRWKVSFPAIGAFIRRWNARLTVVVVVRIVRVIGITGIVRISGI